jgi:MvdD-like protein with pre-ATP grasp domain
MILILTQSADPHADAVMARLQERAAAVVRFNPADFPTRASVSVAYGTHGLTAATLETRGATIDLVGLTSVWWRRPQTPAADEANSDAETRRYVSEECVVVLNDIWHTLPGRFVPAVPAVLRRAELKAAQLVVAAKLGFELPPTLVTTSPREFLAFYREHGGNLISKLPSGTLHKLQHAIIARYTQVVSTRDVGHAEALRRCPIILQAYVPKRLEIRATVVGSAIFAAEIHSQYTHRTRHDWRRYDHSETPYLPHALPDEVAERCRRLVRELGLCYGAIDLVLTPDGRYVFLEINPNGQYLWIEHATGMPITEAMCDLLLTGSGVGMPGPGSLEGAWR